MPCWLSRSSLGSNSSTVQVRGRDPLLQLGCYSRKWHQLFPRRTICAGAQKLLQKGFTPELHLAVDTLCSIDSLVPVLKTFQADFPAILVQLHSEATHDALEKVLRGDCSIGILSSTLPLAPALMGRPLLPVTLAAVARADHPLASQQQPISYRSAHQHCRIILRPRASAVSQYPGRSWVVTDFSAKLSLIRAGLGWGYLPRHLAESQIAGGILRELKIEDPHRQNEYPVFAVHHKARKLDPAAQRLVETLWMTGP